MSVFDAFEVTAVVAGDEPGFIKVTLFGFYNRTDAVVLTLPKHLSSRCYIGARFRMVPEDVIGASYTGDE